MASMTENLPPASRKIATGKERQARIAGGVLIALAVLVGLVFAQGTVGDATFRLSRPNDPMAVPNLVVPAGPFTYLAAALLASESRASSGGSRCITLPRQRCRKSTGTLDCLQRMEPRWNSCIREPQKT